MASPRQVANAGEGGFVLPYVLLTLTILSILMSMVMLRMADISATMRAFVADADAEVALASLEAEATYRLLTAVPVDTGLSLDLPDPEGAERLGRRPERAAPRQLLRGSGTTVRMGANGTDTISLRDATGLIPLNSENRELMALYLQTLGVGRDASRSLAAKWIDFKDDDQSRSFRGAERADYRMRGMAPPTDRPLRSHHELRDILEWQDVTRGEQLFTLMDETSVHNLTTVFNPAFAAPGLIARLERARPGVNLARDVSDDSDLIVGERTSQIWRVRLATRLPDGSTKIRVMDLERRLGALRRPHATRYLYDRTLDPVSVGSSAGTSGSGEDIILSGGAQTSSGPATPSPAGGR